MLRRAGFVNAESSPPEGKLTRNNVDFAWDGGLAKWNHLSGERDDNAENHILPTDAGFLDPNTCAVNIAPMHFCLQSLTKVRQLLVKFNYSDCHVNLTTCLAAPQDKYAAEIEAAVFTNAVEYVVSLANAADARRARAPLDVEQLQFDVVNSAIVTRKLDKGHVLISEGPHVAIRRPPSSQRGWNSQMPRKLSHSPLVAA
jgi:hypothetical protein